MADVQEVERLAKGLIAKHCPDWRFAWDRAKTSYGMTRYQIKTITLSKPLTPLQDMEHVLDTILHEIAHVKAGGAAGHGPVWKAHARALGATPKRTSEGGGTAKKLREDNTVYVGVCPNGHIARRYMKKPPEKVRGRKTAARSCGKCSNVFDSRYIITVYAVDESPVPV